MLTVICIITQPVQAQQSANSISAIEPAVTKVEITGTYIRRTDTETPSPLQVITADDLKKSGYTLISQVLQNIVANGQGSLSNMQSAASFAAGGTGVALRGLNTSSTLVLIDGHRMAPYALPDNAQFSFVDVNNIPFDTVERIEILKDSASSVYGSDAIAGVINIILKSSFVGTKVSVEAGGTQEGGAAAMHASIIHGAGDIHEDGYNAFASIELRHQNEVTYASRLGLGQWSTPNFDGYGGNNKTPGVIGLNSLPQTASPYLVPASGPNAGNASSAYFQTGSTCTNTELNSANGCPWVPHFQLAPSTENVNFLTGFSKSLGNGWTLTTKASLFVASTTVQAGSGYMPGLFASGAPQAYVQGNPFFDGGVALSANNPPPGKSYGPPSIAAITVPVNYPGNTSGTPAYIEGTISAAPSLNQNRFQSKATRVVADLYGVVGEWDIKTSLGYTRNSVATFGSGNTMNIPAFEAAINRPNNPFNIFSRNNSAADTSAIYPDTYANSLSLLEFGEIHLSSSLMTLAGGDFGISTGATYVHRDLEFEAPDLVAQGIVPGNIAWASGHQNDASIYGELVAPVLKSLEVDTSGRFDHIDTYGNSVTGKAAIKWTPIDSFALRGSVSTGFRAPNISESGNAGNIAFYGTTYDPTYCPGGPAGNRYPVGAAVSVAGVNTCNYAPPVLTTGNSELRPERSVSLTFGAIIEPIKGWSSTLDFYRITVHDQIEIPSPNFQSLPATRSATSIIGQCSLNGTITSTVPCSVYPVLYYQQPFLNLDSTMTDGFELGSSYLFKMQDYGDLKSELSWSHVISYLMTQNGVAYQLAGTHGPSAISNDTGNPSNRVQAILTWMQGPLQIATTVNWISNFNIIDPSGGQPTCAAAASNNGWFSGTNPPNNYCKVASFLNTNIKIGYAMSHEWKVFGTTTNLFNRQPPVDLETYGNLGVAVNNSMHSAGVTGRSFSIGTSYNF